MHICQIFNITFHLHRIKFGLNTMNSHCMVCIGLASCRMVSAACAVLTPDLMCPCDLCCTCKLRKWTQREEDHTNYAKTDLEEAKEWRSAGGGCSAWWLHQFESIALIKVNCQTANYKIHALKLLFWQVYFGWAHEVSPLGLWRNSDICTSSRDPCLKKILLCLVSSPWTPFP